MYYEGLKTTDGRKIEILDYGIRNKDSGADFKNAKIRIEGNLFNGDIEIHRSQKDWYLHKHKGDDKYNKVILQVVFWEEDFPGNTVLPKVSKSREVPTVILSEFLTKSIHEIWREIIDNPSTDFKLPCYPENDIIDKDLKNEWVKTLSMKRLNYRAERLNSRLESIEELTGTEAKKSIWEKLFFEYILEALGFSKNKEQFLKFAELIDYNKVREFGLTETEEDAFFFGTAGFLSGLKYKDEYIEELKKNWEKLREKFKPAIMNKAEWNFFRLRPQNFPTVRMAYAVSVFRELSKCDLLKRIVLCFEKSRNTKKDIQKLFTDVQLPEYWKNHYVFGKLVKTNIKSIGGERVNDIITNVVLPMIYLYSKIFDRGELMEKVIQFYSNTKEKNDNEVTKAMQKQIGIRTSTISGNQGLIHLHNFYCVKEKCDECEIGKIVLNKNKNSDSLRIILY
jgi:hypothetical protein